MKKTIAILLIITMLAVFVSCGKSEPPAENATVSDQRAYEIAAEVPQARAAAQTIQAASSFAGGSGTQDDPYRIADASQLAYFAELFASEDTAREYRDKNYVLSEDITINTAQEMQNAQTQAPTYGFTPIADSFSGVFDGQGHTISGIYVITVFDGVTGAGSNIGLFSRIDKATVRDLTIADSAFFSLNRINAAGALAGQQSGSKIENCVTRDVTVSVNEGHVGGLVGSNIGTVDISGCETDGRTEVLQGPYFAGGITSSINDGTVADCVNHCSVFSRDDCAGGIAALVSTNAAQNSWEDKVSGAGKTVISGCENHGDIVSETAEAGGIAGHASAANADCEIVGCSSDGAVQGKEQVAGIIGRAEVTKNFIDSKADHQGQLTIDGCRNSGEITAADGNAAGLVGYLRCSDGAAFVLTGSENSGTINASGIFGGILGVVVESQSTATVSVADCSNSGAVRGSGTQVGGIVGSITSIQNSSLQFEVADCVNSGAVEPGSGLAAGGIIGAVKVGENCATKISFSGCSNSGLLTKEFDLKTLSFAGGIAGDLTCLGTEPIRLSDCMNTGEIRAVLTGDEPSESTLCHIGGVAGNVVGTVTLQSCAQNGETDIPDGIHYDPSVGLGEAEIK